jgi:hypothetical protein
VAVAAVTDELVTVAAAAVASWVVVTDGVVVAARLELPRFKIVAQLELIPESILEKAAVKAHEMQSREMVSSEIIQKLLL